MKASYLNYQNKDRQYHLVITKKKKKERERGGNNNNNNKTGLVYSSTTKVIMAGNLKITVQYICN